VPVIFLSAAFAVGAFASTTRYEVNRLDAKIDGVEGRGLSQLEAAIRMRSIQMEQLERRIQMLEQIAKDNAESLKGLERGQAVIVANISYQSGAVETISRRIENLQTK
jgi:hypothetical protein